MIEVQPVQSNLPLAGWPILNQNPGFSSERAVYDSPTVGGSRLTVLFVPLVAGSAGSPPWLSPTIQMSALLLHGDHDAPHDNILAEQENQQRRDRRDDDAGVDNIGIRNALQ